MNKIQYWKNGVMLTTVTEAEAKEIMDTARKIGGLHVYDCGHYFSVEDAEYSRKTGVEPKHKLSEVSA